MMKKRIEIYQQKNRVCKLLLCAMVCLAGCSPKESEILLFEQSNAVLVESNAQTGLSVQGETDVQTKEQMQGEVAFGTEESVKTFASDRELEELQTILVHVCGAVRNPGVVTLDQGSRASDALEAAGGFLEDANRTYVNLAAEVVDGQQLFFPTEEEVDTMEMWQALQGVENGNAAIGLAGGKVNINTADENTLCTLPGIGTSKAQAIMEYRRANGPFASIEDIMKVQGIKTSAYEKIQDKITVQ